jgi:PST family polysaccharide transporter
MQRVAARLGDLWESGGRRTARALAATGSGALASSVLSAVASKILAAQAGPAAIATLVTLQQVRQGALIAATVNGQTAVIQGASSRTAQERREYVRTAALLFSIATVLVCGGCVVFAGALRNIAGLGLFGKGVFGWIAVSVLFSSALIFVTSLLNAMGRIQTLAKVQIVSPLVLAVGMWPVARAVRQTLTGDGPGSLAMLAALATGIAAAAAVWPLVAAWPQWKDWVRGPGSWWSRGAAQSFLSVSLAMFVSGGIATGALLMVRGRIISQQGLTAAGWFDAAWNISMNHASLLLASLQTYCLPLLARAQSAREQSEHIRSVLLLAMPIAAVMIAAIALVKPWVVEMLYAPSFRPSAGLLRWTLLGDYLKIGSWILSLPLLARADMKAFLLLDTAAYATFAGVSILLSRRIAGAESAALGFVCMYGVHLVAAAALARWRCGIELERSAVAVWCAGLAVVLLISGMTWNRI